VSKLAHSNQETMDKIERTARESEERGERDEPRQRTIEEIRTTPVGLLTDAEIAQLGPEGQAYARSFKEQKAREAACPGHERVSTATREETRRGYHRAECKHCRKNMTIDSTD
jgi:hypothetical protein